MKCSRWDPVVGEAQAMLEAVPEAKRGTSLLLNNVAIMLKNQGRLAEAEALQRMDLAAERAEGGDRAPNTLVALASLAVNLQAQGKLAKAEPLFREVLAARALEQIARWGRGYTFKSVACVLHRRCL